MYYWISRNYAEPGFQLLSKPVVLLTDEHNKTIEFEEEDEKETSIWEKLFQNVSGYYIVFGARATRHSNDWVRLVFSVHESFYDLVSTWSLCDLHTLDLPLYGIPFIIVFFSNIISTKAHVRFRDETQDVVLFRSLHFLRIIARWASFFHFASIVIDGSKIIENFDVGDKPAKFGFTLYSQAQSHARSQSKKPNYPPAIKYRIAKTKLEQYLISHNIQESSYSLYEGATLMPVIDQPQKLFQLYVNWLIAMDAYVVSEDSIPNPELRQLVLKLQEFNSHGDRAVLLTAKHNFYRHALPSLCLLFLSGKLFLSKYPVLQASIYLWRIQHLFTL